MAPRKPTHPVELYIRSVMDGTKDVSLWERRAVERHVRDSKDGPGRGLRFNPVKAQHSIDFYQFLRHSKGEWSGNRVVLEPWQQFNRWCLFGWYREDGTRRFRTYYGEVPRKNGKSTSAAGDGLYFFMADGEPGAEIYSAATTRQQARIVHSEAMRMVASSPDLKKRISVFKDNLNIEDTASKYEPLSSDFNTLDGLNPHAAIIDELHAHKDGGLVEKIRTAFGSRRSPVLYYITTAGVTGESIGWREHQYARGVLDGSFIDDSYFAFIATANESDDPFDPLTWQRANPNYGVSVKPSMLKESAERAARQAGLLNEFLRYHLNIWTNQSRRWLDLNAWDRCEPQYSVEDLAGDECYVGVDLANTTDIACTSYVWPPKGDRKKWVTYQKMWVPKERVRDRVVKDRVPYDLWVKQGFLIETPGNIIDYDAIRADINKNAKRFNIVELGYDPWGATQIAVQLAGDGILCTPVRQGYHTLSEPAKFVEGLILEGDLDHMNNPVLRWMASNVEVMTDPAGNIKPAKDKSPEKIDGVVALITAIARAICAEDGTSIYESQGVRLV